MQLSVLRVLHKILADPRARKQPAMAEPLRFATGLVRNLMARLVPDVESVTLPGALLKACWRIVSRAWTEGCARSR